MTLETWLADFTKDKKEVHVLERRSDYAAHSIQRYLDKNHLLWETAQTYTGRLVLRSGTIEPDGISVKWGEWTTLHDVDLPQKR